MSSHPSIDIIMPVWNRPVETRNCLVNLLNHSSNFRLIIVDNGSDRETEKMLQEFCEGLDDQALLLRNDVNQGLVKALNQGLEKAAADYFVIIRSTSLVGAGWLEPLLAFFSRRSEAGLVVPLLVEMGTGSTKKRPGDVCEISFGSFAAMLIKKEVYAAIGGFDEGMDGGVWCLKDFTRRALQAGFLTFRVPDVTIQYVKDVQLGSEIRRQENLQKTVAEFNRRWGTESSFCLLAPKDAAAEMNSVLELLLQGARQSFKFHLVVDHQLHKKLIKSGLSSLHENIRIYPLPFFHTSSSVKKLITSIVSEEPGTTVVAAADGINVAGIESQLSFAQLEGMIRSCNDKRD